MGREHYKDLGRTIGGYPCGSITKKLDDVDDVISGPYGDIRSILDKSSKPYREIGYQVLLAQDSISEKIISFSFAQLHFWVKVIKAPRWVTLQLPYANDPNGKLDRKSISTKKYPTSV